MPKRSLADGPSPFALTLLKASLALCLYTVVALCFQVILAHRII